MIRSGINTIIESHKFKSPPSTRWATADWVKSYTPIEANTNGTVHTYTVGEHVINRPEMSISFALGLFRQINRRMGTDRVLLNKRGPVNDDNIASRFSEKIPLLPKIEEEMPARYILIIEKGAPFYE
jgi:D-lyxose ketol-isomerase